MAATPGKRALERTDMCVGTCTVHSKMQWTSHRTITHARKEKRTSGVIREKLSRLGRARGKQKGGVVVGSLCGPGSVGPGTSLGF